MIEQLKLAGDQLRAAWAYYHKVYSTLQDDEALRIGPNAQDFPSELIHQLDVELGFLSSYESKIRDIKVTIGRVRNYSSGRTSINSLPAEILRGIFHLVVAQPCVPYLSSASRRHCPRSADCLAHVSYLWRRIALSSCELWCRIDLSPYSWTDGFVTRLRAYVARVGTYPLELHIASECDIYSVPEHSELYWLLLLLARNAIALEIWMGWNRDCSRHSVLGILLRQRLALDKLVVHSNTCNNPHIPFKNRSYYRMGDHQPLVSTSSFTTNAIEDNLASLTVLHLCDIFPSLSSKAYHGLVDLRLLSRCAYDSYIAREADLTNILKSSPRLRILHFGLEICDITPFSERVNPVYLQDLQVVKTFVHDTEGTIMPPSYILRLLAPGTKPLRLSIEGLYTEGALSIFDAEAFFNRSRVEMFHARAIFLPRAISKKILS